MELSIEAEGQHDYVGVLRTTAYRHTNGVYLRKLPLPMNQ